MPGSGLGLILLAGVVAVFVSLVWNSVELAAEGSRRRPLRRRLLVGVAVPVGLVAAAFVILGRAT